MKASKTAVFDVRTLLLLDILIMIFMLISGKPEVTLSSFILAAAVPVITELNLFGNFSFRTGCLKIRRLSVLRYFVCRTVCLLSVHLSQCYTGISFRRFLCYRCFLFYCAADYPFYAARDGNTKAKKYFGDHHSA